jgi:hypothetical protein
MSATDIIREGDAGALTVNDYVYSPSQVYFGALEKSGDFTIYAGESPSDPEKAKVWSTGSAMPAGYEVTQMLIRKGPFDNRVKNLQIFCHDPNHGSTLTQAWQSPGSSDLDSVMEGRLADDGSLSLRQLDRVVWDNGFSDSLLDYSLTKIDYDTRPDQVHRKPVGEPQILEIQRVKNGTGAPQTFPLEKTSVLSTTHSWSNKTGITVGVKSTTSVSIPLVGSESVEWSASVTDEFTFGKSVSDTQSIKLTLSLTVLPGKTYKAWASITQIEFELPFTTTGVFRFKSGRQIARTIQGTFRGLSGYVGQAGYDDITDEKSPKNLFTAKGAEVNQFLGLKRSA